MDFNWDNVQYKEDGKVLLLYRHERIFEEGLVKPGMSIADVGGWGHLSERIRQEGSTCLIMDKFTNDQYYPARVKMEPHIEIDICAPVETFKKYENSFDLVTCFEVLEHVEDQERAIKNIYHILKYNGYIAGTVPIPGYSHKVDEVDIEFIDTETLSRYLKNAGFCNVVIEPTPSINKEDPDKPSLYFKGWK